MEALLPADVEPDLVSEIEDIFTDVYIAPVACGGLGAICGAFKPCCFKWFFCEDGKCVPID